jgi:hypothetical protein
VYQPGQIIHMRALAPCAVSGKVSESGSMVDHAGHEEKITDTLTVSSEATAERGHAAARGGRFPIRAKAPASSVYEYYNPEVRGEAPPVALTVR